MDTEPTPKRQCQELWIKVNTAAVARLRMGTLTVADLIDNLEVRKNVCHSIVVKNKGDTLRITDNVPETTVNTPVVIISKVEINAEIDGKFEIINCADPTKPLGYYIIVQEHVELKKSVAVLENKIVEWNIPVHALSGKTEIGGNILKVFTTISVNVILQYTNYTEENNCNVHGKSNVQHLLTNVAKLLPENFKSSDLMAFKDNIDVTTSKKYVIEYNVDTPFYIRHKYCSVEDKIDQMVKYTHPPTTYSNSSASNLTKSTNKEKALNFQHFPLCYPRAGIGNDTSIYYEGFNDFLEKSVNNLFTQEDTVFTNLLCLAMEKTYSSEKLRLKSFKELFESYTGLLCTSVQFDSNAICDFVIGNSFGAILEGNNEAGSTMNDPLKQLVAYYLDSLQHRKNTTVKNCSCPCYLLELVGPQLTISSIVFGEKVYIDRLVPPLYLLRQKSKSSCMQNLARTLCALKESLLALNTFYSNHVQLSQPRFPFLQQINGFDLTYKKTKMNNMFTGTYQERNVIIKFCETYGKSVHELLATEGLAPDLIYFGQVGRLSVVVMDEVQGIAIDRYIHEHCNQRANVVNQFEKFIEVMNSKNYCHGDLRPCNILVKSDGTLNVLDFDWAGECGIATYPFFLNHVDITWPSGVKGGAKITREHDQFWIKQYLS